MSTYREQLIPYREMVTDMANAATDDILIFDTNEPVNTQYSDCTSRPGCPCHFCTVVRFEPLEEDVIATEFLRQLALNELEATMASFPTPGL